MARQGIPARLSRRWSVKPSDRGLSRRAVGQVPSGTEAMRGGDGRSITIRRADRRAWLTAAVLVLTAMLDGPAIAADEPVLVIMKNHQFEPRLLHVRPGQAIRFHNSDDVLHSLLLASRQNVTGHDFLHPH